MVRHSLCVDLPEFRTQEFQLDGGRRLYRGRDPRAELIYRFRKHKISVFHLPGRGRGQAPMPSTRPAKARIVAVEAWSAGRCGCFILGDAGAEDIAKLASLF